MKYIIDCDADPFVPKGWRVKEHQKGGQLDWFASSVMLHLDPSQRNGKYFEGKKIRKLLKGMPVLNANVLDYLLKNPYLIPEGWKKDESGNTRRIFFWGTTYLDLGGFLNVRYLYWAGDKWSWRGDWVGIDWHRDSPAAVRTL